MTAGTVTPPDAASVRLTQRRVFILPTRQGTMFGVTLFLMLIGSINYNLSLGYVLTFLLTGLLVVAMLHTWRNLAGLEVAVGRQENVFAGEPARFHLFLRNPSGLARSAIGTRCGIGPYHHVDVPADDVVGTHVDLLAPRRGRLTPGKILVVTTYPVGLFRAWSYVRLPASLLAYPRPEKGAIPLPDALAIPGTGAAPAGGDEDFDGLRNYRRGDSPRRIAWKVLARRGEPATKEFAGGAGARELWLDWQDCPRDFGIEQRLSRLTSWVLQMEGTGIAYGLRLPAIEIPVSQGQAHRDRCLESLATYGLEDAT